MIDTHKYNRYSKKLDILRIFSLLLLSVGKLSGMTFFCFSFLIFFYFSARNQRHFILLVDEKYGSSFGIVLFSS